MAKKPSATQAQATEDTVASGQETQATVDAGSPGETEPAPKLKEHSELITDLHQIWDDLITIGKDAEAEFMAVINSKLSGKTHEEVRALHQQAQQNAKAVADQFDADAEWQQRNAAHRAEAEANKQTRIDRAKRNSRR